jgi:predicted nuclease of restriction endonuclease-like (RecB) superfamily
LQQPTAKSPWFYDCLILHKTKDKSERLWYIQAAIERGWSRNVLEIPIKARLRQRQSKAITNFAKTLPTLHSDCVHPARIREGCASNV